MRPLLVGSRSAPWEVKGMHEDRIRKEVEESEASMLGGVARRIQEQVRSMGGAGEGCTGWDGWSEPDGPEISSCAPGCGIAVSGVLT